MKGWHYEGWRHSLAARGIKTSVFNKSFARKDYDDKLREISEAMGRGQIPEIGKIETAFENIGQNHVREVQYIYDKDGDLIDERVVDIYKRGVNNQLHSLIDKGKILDLAAKKKFARWQK